VRALPLSLLLLGALPAFAQPTPVTGEILISVSGETSRLRPGVAADRRGRFIVVWREISGQDGGIAGRWVNTAGRPEGEGFLIEALDEGRHTGDPRVVCRSDGAVLAAWGESAFLRPGCARARLLVDGEDSEAFDLGDCAAENGRAPNVALAGLPDGRFTAVWEEGAIMTAAATDVVVRSFAAPGVPFAEKARVDGEEGTAADGVQTAPAVAQDAAGRAVALWYDQSTAVLFARRFDASGRPLGGPFRVTGNGNGFPLETAVAAAPDGRFVAVWSAFDGNATRIFAQRFDRAGRKRGASIQVSPPGSPSHRHREPDVDVDDDGNFVVVWDADRVDSAGTGVLGRLYDWDGKPQGPVFRINLTGGGSQGHPAAAFAPGSAGGRFLVVWDSQRDVDARGKIVGRLYAALPTVVP
jgi:hypothetical protein